LEEFVVTAEKVDQIVEWDTNTSVNGFNHHQFVNKTFFLPSLTAKYSISEKISFVLRASQNLYLSSKFKEQTFIRRCEA
jgi:neutral trehalase